MNYRKIWEKVNGPIPVDENGISYEIHHIDGNRSNNDLSNLICISIKEHYEIHLKQGDYLAAQMISRKIKNGIFSGWHHTEEMKQKLRDKKVGTKNVSQSEFMKLNNPNNLDHVRKSASERMKGDKNPMKNPKVAKKMSDIIKAVWENKDHPMKGRKHTQATIQKMKKPKNDDHKEKIKSRVSQVLGKPVVNNNTGEVYETVTKAAKMLNLSTPTIRKIIKTGSYLSYAKKN
jgi:hypothetical protein